MSLLQPMLYCKNAVQQARPFTIDPRVLYRGLLMSVTNMGVLTGAQVCVRNPGIRGCAYVTRCCALTSLSPSPAPTLTSSR